MNKFSRFWGNILLCMLSKRQNDVLEGHEIRSRWLARLIFLKLVESKVRENYHVSGLELNSNCSLSAELHAQVSTANDRVKGVVSCDVLNCWFALSESGEILSRRALPKYHVSGLRIG